MAQFEHFAVVVHFLEHLVQLVQVLLEVLRLFDARPEAFLSLFELEHSSGSSAKGSLRAWGPARRDEIAARVADGTAKLLAAAAEAQPEAVPAPGDRREQSAAAALVSATWLEAAEHVEAVWLA